MAAHGPESSRDGSPHELTNYLDHFTTLRHDGESILQLWGLNSLAVAIDDYLSQNSGYSIDETIEHHFMRPLSLQTRNCSKKAAILCEIWSSIPPTTFAMHKKDGEADSGLIFDTYRPLQCSAPTELFDGPFSVLFSTFCNLMSALLPVTTDMAADGRGPRMSSPGLHCGQNRQVQYQVQGKQYRVRTHTLDK